MPLVLYHITVSNAVPFPDLRNQETRLDFLSPQEFEASTAVLKPLNDQLPTQEAMDYFQATADQLASHINEIDMSFLYVASKLFLFTLFVIPNFFFFFFFFSFPRTLKHYSLPDRNPNLVERPLFLSQFGSSIYQKINPQVRGELNHLFIYFSFLKFQV